MADEDPLNTLAADPDKLAADGQEVKDVASPIFSRSWQAVFSVSTAGGTLRKPGSDVMIEVPAGAVDDTVAVHSAVCTDTDRVARVLGLQGGESVCSPLAEYWAGHDFCFHKPVRITLPHFLPPNPDPRLVRVYRLTGRPDGHITITRLRPDDPSCTGEGHTEPEAEHAVTDDTSPRHETSSAPRKDPTLEQDLQASTVWDETGTFTLSSEDHISIVTDQFCGYVCTYCGKQQGPPVLKALTYGSPTHEPNGQLCVDVKLLVWDKRISIQDFAQNLKIPADQREQTRNISLRNFPGDVYQSKLHVRLNLDHPQLWQLSREGVDGPLVTEAAQHRYVNIMLGCDDISCDAMGRDRSCPAQYDWRVESKPGWQLRSHLYCTLDICLLPDQQNPCWDQADCIERWIVKFVTETSPSPAASGASQNHNSQRVTINIGTLKSDKVDISLQPARNPERNEEEMPNSVQLDRPGISESPDPNASSPRPCLPPSQSNSDYAGGRTGEAGDALNVTIMSDRREPVCSPSEPEV